MPIIICPVCERAYDDAQIQDLDHIGTMAVGDPDDTLSTVELVQCHCHNTLAIPVFLMASEPDTTD